MKKKKKSSKNSKKKISKRKALKAARKKSKKKAIKKAKRKLKSKKASLKKKAKKKAKKVLKKKAKAKKRIVKKAKAKKTVAPKKRALAPAPISTLPQELKTVEESSRPLPGGFEVERKEVVEGADRIEVKREKVSYQQKELNFNDETPFSDEGGSSEEDLIEDLDESDLPPGLKD